MMLKNEIVAGDLVMRGALMFLVIQIGRDYHEGFALCKCLGRYSHNEPHWIMKTVLKPL